MIHSTLPKELIPHYVKAPDQGGCIKCILEVHIDEAMASENMDEYVIPLPVDYVMDMGYRFVNGYVVVEAEYDSTLGVLIPDRYNDDIIKKKSDAGARDLHAYTSGEIIPEFIGGREGTRLLIDDNGLVLHVYLRKPTPLELEALSNGSCEFRICELNSVLFILGKFGDMEWMDFSFHPLLERSVPVLSEPREGEGYALTLMVIDVSSGELKNLRLMGLGTEFSKKVKKAVENLSKDKTFTPTAYFEGIDRLYQRYSTKDLLNFSSARFRIHK